MSASVSTSASQSIRAKLESKCSESHLTKLVKALDMLTVLEKRHADLLKEYEILAEKYAYTKLCSIDSVWRYAPMASRDFKHLPRLDKELLETDNQIGDYMIAKNLGEGQYSIVKKCTKKGYKPHFCIVFATL